MIDLICKEIKKDLPLSVESVTWTYPVLHFYGENWSFVSMTTWRVINKGKIVCSSASDELEKIGQLKNAKIIDLRVQSVSVLADPTFIFSNGLVLEVFSTTGYDPWTFHLPNGKIYLGLGN